MVKYSLLLVNMVPIGVTLGFSSRTFIANEGTGAPCQICIQLLAGTLEKSIHAYVTTGELGTAKCKFVCPYFTNFYIIIIAQLH